MTEDGSIAICAICATVLILFCWGDPDLLDAIISWLNRH